MFTSLLPEATGKSATAISGFGSRASETAVALGQDGSGGRGILAREKRGRHDAKRGSQPRRGFPLKSSNHSTARADHGGGQQPKSGRGEKGGRDGARSPRQSSGRRHSLSRDGAGHGDPAGSAHPRPPSPSASDASSGGKAMAPLDAESNISKQINDTLEADGIHPPAWPANPGGAKHEMSRFRELYEAYRQRMRKSLIKAGLIDDPQRRKRLSEAITFRGICEDMCPEYEKISRITEQDVNRPERDRFTGAVRPRSMVKKLARSAAGQEAPLPMDVRSMPALRRTLDHLIDVVLRIDENLLDVHSFLWDRTRAIRRDFAFFSSVDAEDIEHQVYVLENITRFHVTSLHLLSRRDKGDDRFVEQQEVEQLAKTLLSLQRVYDQCNYRGIECGNEAEFRAYFLLFHAHDPSILETVQGSWARRFWLASKDMQTAVTLIEALHSSHDFVGVRRNGTHGPLLSVASATRSFFDIAEDDDVSYTMACFAECHFSHVRRSILTSIKRALTRPRDPVQDVTAEALNSFLRFDTIEQAIKFARLHNIEFAPDEEKQEELGQQRVVLRDRSLLPHVKLAHEFSQCLVEKKRGLASITDVIHFTVFRNSGLAKGTGSTSFDAVARLPPPPDSPTKASASTKTASTSSAKPQAKAPTGANHGNPFAIDDSDTDGSSDEARVALFAASKPTVPNAPVKHAAKLSNLTDAEARHSKESLVGGTHLSGHRRSAFGHPATTTVPSDSAPPAKPNPFAPSSFQSPVRARENGSTAAEGAWADPLVSAAPGFSGGGHSAAQKEAPVQPNPFARPSPSSSNSVNAFGDTGPKMKLFAGSGSSGNTAAARTEPKTNPFAGPSPSLRAFASPQPQANGFAEPATSAAPASVAAAPGNPLPVAPNPFGFLTRSDTDTQRPLGPTQKNEADPLPTPASPESGAAGSLATEAFVGSRADASLPPTGSAHPSFASATSHQQASPHAAPAPAATTQEPQLLAEPRCPADLLVAPVGGEQPPASTTSAAGSPVPAASPTKAAVEPIHPPRDLIGDVNKWYVLADGGLLSDFLVESVRQITEDVSHAFETEKDEQIRLEEARRVDEEVETFRVYNLRIKFFYRWKIKAREKRMRQVRRQGREEMRAYLAEKRAAERRARQEEVSERERMAAAVRESSTYEYIDSMKTKLASRRWAQTSLTTTATATGASLGTDEKGASARMAGDASLSSRYSPSEASQSSEPAQPPSRKEGSKTRALRELIYGGDKPERFRRSLPSMSSSMGGGLGETWKASNLSPRARLNQATGVAPSLPNGTAVPKALAHHAAYSSTTSPLQRRSMESWRVRRISAEQAVEAALGEAQTSRRGHSATPNGAKLLTSGDDDGGSSRQRLAAGRKASDKRVLGDTTAMAAATTTGTKGSDKVSPSNKRKRRGDDEKDDMGEDDVADAGAESAAIEHPLDRGMHNTKKVLTDLRSMRAELEEGTRWFRSQRERLQRESTAATQ